MVPVWRARLGRLRGPWGLERVDRIGAERALDLAVTPDPRGEHQAADLGVAIEGHLGLVTGHLDPDGFLGLALGLDRVQANGPDRRAVPRDGLPLLVLEVRPGLGRPAHPELDAARVDQKSHDASPLPDWLEPVG